MLRFAVYDKNGPASDWPLVNAYLVGPEDKPATGEVTFADGQIRCKPKTTHAVGLCLQYDAGPLGRVMLQTCLLPERERPYDLTVELARHRIKMFIAKSEDWQMFDLDSDHPAMRKWERARERFSEAVNTADRTEANQAAHEALLLAIESTERLALTHAEIFLHWRFGTRPASTRTLGVRVHPGRDEEALRDVVKKNFDLIAIPLRWSELEVEEGRYEWEPVDRWITWAAREGIPVLLGPLLDFSAESLPKWMYVWQHDYSTCRDLTYEFVERVVHRYRNNVGIWNIARGLNICDNFPFTLEQMLDLARMANLQARQARKGARTMVELAEPFGEHCAKNKRSIYPVDFVTRLNAEGIQVDCLGLQLLFGQAAHGRATRDLMHLSDIVDRYWRIEMPVVISAFGVPSEVVDKKGGWWRSAWTPERQEKWMSRAFAITMSKPFVETMLWTDLYDHPGADLPAGGLIDEQGHPKPVLKRLVKTRKRLKKPLGPMKSEPLAARHV